MIEKVGTGASQKFIVTDVVAQGEDEAEEIQINPTVWGFVGYVMYCEYSKKNRKSLKDFKWQSRWPDEKNMTLATLQYAFMCRRKEGECKSRERVSSCGEVKDL